jgi:hypothetical protein
VSSFIAGTLDSLVPPPAPPAASAARNARETQSSTLNRYVNEELARQRAARGGA